MTAPWFSPRAATAPVARGHALLRGRTHVHASSRHCLSAALAPQMLAPQMLDGKSCDVVYTLPIHPQRSQRSLRDQHSSTAALCVRALFVHLILVTPSNDLVAWGGHVDMHVDARFDGALPFFFGLSLPLGVSFSFWAGSFPLVLLLLFPPLPCPFGLNAHAAASRPSHGELGVSFQSLSSSACHCSLYIIALA